MRKNATLDSSLDPKIALNLNKVKTNLYNTTTVCNNSNLFQTKIFFITKKILFLVNFLVQNKNVIERTVI